MKKPILILILFGLAAALLPAQTQAVIREARGKVELQTAAQQPWIPAKAGMRVSLGSTISTGFNSLAVLDLGGSVVQVNPLTRMRLNELVQKEGTIQTDLFLRVGKVKAEVKSAEGLALDFKVKSPVSTAAVRGTGFDYDGYELYVYEGVVTVTNLIGQSRSYGSGEEGGTGGYDTPAEGQAGKEAGSSVDPYAPGVGGQSGGGIPAKPEGALTGGLIIIIPFPYEQQQG